METGCKRGDVGYEAPEREAGCKRVDVEGFASRAREACCGPGDVEV